MNASAIFDEALGKVFEKKKKDFLWLVSGMFSNETEDSLNSKIEIIKERMSQGRYFTEICDDLDVFLGKVDRDYVSYRLDNEKNQEAGFEAQPVSYDKWKENHLYGQAMSLIR